MKGRMATINILTALSLGWDVEHLEISHCQRWYKPVQILEKSLAVSTKTKYLST